MDINLAWEPCPSCKGEGCCVSMNKAIPPEGPHPAGFCSLCQVCGGSGEVPASDVETVGRPTRAVPLLQSNPAQHA